MRTVVYFPHIEPLDALAELGPADVPPRNGDARPWFPCADASPSRTSPCAPLSTHESAAAISGRRLDVGVKTVGVSLAPPALTPWLASTLNIGIAEPVGVGAALLLLGTKVLLDREVARDRRDTTPWSYLLRVPEELPH